MKCKGCKVETKSSILEKEKSDPKNFICDFCYWWRNCYNELLELEISRMRDGFFEELKEEMERRR